MFIVSVFVVLEVDDAEKDVFDLDQLPDQVYPFVFWFEPYNLGMVKLTNDEQPVNADSLIVVTESAIIMLVKVFKFAQAFVLIVPLPIIKFVKEDGI